jgi:3-dehydroquinate synthase
MDQSEEWPLLGKRSKSGYCIRCHYSGDSTPGTVNHIPGELTIPTFQQHFTVDFSYPVVFTRDVFNPDNPNLADVIRQSGSQSNLLLLVVDSEVMRVTPDLPEKITRYARRYAPLFALAAPLFLVRGGEICKNDPVEIAQIHGMMERFNLCRHSFVIVIGGGAVLDAVGYATATAHRGIRLIRIPTTVLAQNDAGIGVKNGINVFGRKNFLGTFAPPYAVINDSLFLETLQERDLRAGIAEAVKVALIRDRAFFDFLYTNRQNLSRFFSEEMEQMISRCAQIHLQHIATSGDPFENGSSRPLDFGHWSAHKLEELSKSDLRHGEAVAIGIALDAIYSRQSCLLGEDELQRILTLLEELGFALYHPALDMLDVEKALADFREHLGGVLSIPLLAGIGVKTEAKEIDLAVMKNCVVLLFNRASKYARVAI